MLWLTVQRMEHSPESWARWVRLWILVLWAHLLLGAQAVVTWQLAHGGGTYLVAAYPSLNASIGWVVALLVRGWRSPPSPLR